MKKWLVPLLVMFATHAEGVFPIQHTKVALKTDIKVKTSKKGTKGNEYSAPGAWTGVRKDKAQSTYLAIEVRNMSPKIVKDLKISYQFFELQFDRSSTTRYVFTRTMGPDEKLVPSGRGELTIPQLKPLEKKVVETEPVETSYRSTQDLTKLIPQTKTTGSKFGGYVVEYFAAGQLVKRDASSRSLLEAYLRAIQKQKSAAPLRMNVGR
jgi:hypothetical protein